MAANSSQPLYTPADKKKIDEYNMHMTNLRILERDFASAEMREACDTVRAHARLSTLSLSSLLSRNLGARKALQPCAHSCTHARTRARARTHTHTLTNTHTHTTDCQSHGDKGEAGG